MNVLITGGAGYVGSHTVLALKEQGYHTVVLDSLEKGHRELIHSDRFYQGNITDGDLVRQVIREQSIHAVIHFAAYIEAGESMLDPGRFFTNNTAGSLALFRACYEEGVDRFIFSSTAAIYGFPETVPIGEDSPHRPVNPYGESKLMVERMLDWYHRVHGVRSVALRYFNAAGADPDLRSGELHDPETHLIPIALQAAYKQRPVFRINGNDYNTPDGTCIRDYVHVSDLASAHVLALQYLNDVPGHHAFNVGTERGTSVREIVEEVIRVSGKEFLIEEGPRRPGDPDRLVASSEKIRSLLGWQPRFVEPAGIIETAHRFYCKD